MQFIPCCSTWPARWTPSSCPPARSTCTCSTKGAAWSLKGIQSYCEMLPCPCVGAARAHDAFGMPCCFQEQLPPWFTTNTEAGALIKRRHLHLISPFFIISCSYPVPKSLRFRKSTSAIFREHPSNPVTLSHPQCSRRAHLCLWSQQGQWQRMLAAEVGWGRLVPKYIVLTVQVPLHAFTRSCPAVAHATMLAWAACMH